MILNTVIIGALVGTIASKMPLQLKNETYDLQDGSEATYGPEPLYSEDDDKTCVSTQFCIRPSGDDVKWEECTHPEKSNAPDLTGGPYAPTHINMT